MLLLRWFMILPIPADHPSQLVLIAVPPITSVVVTKLAI